MKAQALLGELAAVARSAAGSDADECAAIAIALERVGAGVHKLLQHVDVRGRDPRLGVDVDEGALHELWSKTLDLSEALASPQPSAEIERAIGPALAMSLPLPLPAGRRNLPRWHPMQSQMLVVPMRDKTLMVQVGMSVPDAAYFVVAVETLGADAVRAAGSGLQVAEMMFANHAHDVLGERPTLEEAVAIAEDYARAWVKGLAPAAEACACGPIGEHPNAEGPG